MIYLHILLILKCIKQNEITNSLVIFVKKVGT